MDQAAQHLVAARRAGQPGARLPESCRPIDLADAIAIQRRVQGLVKAATGGWKCSLPTPERAIACAPIFAASIRRDCPCPVVAHGSTVKIEPEIAFVLGRDLPPRANAYSEGEVRAAIAETRLVLELLDSRYADPAAVSFPEILADQVNNQGLFVGPVFAGGLAAPLEGFPVAVEASARTLHFRGGRHPDGHPLRPLVWLASYLAQQESGLAAGTIVTTGSYAGALEVPVGTALTVRFGELGAIAVTLVG
ncbi:MAG TPA: 2-keto-4-pentenoate hydratase [Casimicrobiaceae bacterium]|nr:2-keto-4-pentenoate hydratase [Casimicrobiaceae bacterium]